jgi:hypothetical protein
MISNKFHFFAALTLRKRLCTHLLGGWVEPRVALDIAGNLTQAVQPVTSRYTDWSIGDLYYPGIYPQIFGWNAN